MDNLSSLTDELAAKIKARRVAANLTQAELAERLGVSTRTLQTWESADSFPRALHRRRLAAFFAEHEDGVAAA